MEAIANQLSSLQSLLLATAQAQELGTVAVGVDVPPKLLFDNVDAEYTHVGAFRPFVDVPCLSNVLPISPAFWRDNPDGYNDSTLVPRLKRLQGKLDAVAQDIDDNSQDPLVQGIRSLKHGYPQAAVAAFEDVVSEKSTDHSILEKAVISETLLTLARLSTDVFINRKTLGEAREEIHARALDLWKEIERSIPLWQAETRGEVEQAGKTIKFGDTDELICLSMIIFHGNQFKDGLDDASEAAFRSAEIFTKQQKPLEAGHYYLLSAYFCLMAGEPAALNFSIFENIYASILALEDAWRQDFKPNSPGQEDASESTDRAAPVLKPGVLDVIAEAKKQAEEIRFRLGVEEAKSDNSLFLKCSLDVLQQMEVYKKLNGDFKSYLSELEAGLIGNVDAPDNRQTAIEATLWAMQVARTAETYAKDHAEWQDWHNKGRELYVMFRKYVKASH